ncbi:MAG: GNAT family N-acetyltransferase [Cellulosilyticum sp.]|nr:GNAT family N-acetyltransferase [Cellulosilyticum sp.]
MRLHDIEQLLTQTYWAKNYTLETIEKSLHHSLSFGVLDETADKQIAFARVITDYATRFYIVDVIVDATYRSKGIGNMLIDAIVHHKDLAPLRGLLITKDAQELYRKFGFEEYGITCMQKTSL